MTFQPDPSAELIDEKGHTREDAALQEPLLDLDAPAASQETPKGGGDVMVPAQTPEEVAAQVRNLPGAPGETHDIDEQIEAAEARGSESAEGDAEGDSAGENDAAEDADADKAPAKNASTEDWQAYAVSQGADEAEVADMTRAELIDEYGDPDGE